MQRVVRSTFVGLLAIAGLTACGDKVTVPPANPPAQVDSSIHSVTVSPASVNLNVGDKVTLAASVDAGPGATVRTVSWSSSNPAVASVDATTGVVTAVAAGNATIIAKANANTNVQGAASVTVGAGPVPQPAVVSISTINSTRCDVLGSCTSVPANLGNATGQLDVTLNVDPGTQKLAGVDLLMNCNAAANFPASSDTVVASQNLSGAASAQAAEAASAPVTLSFNTAAFNSTTGATAFKNGSCVLKARARLANGTVVASSNQPLTLANTDVAIGTLTSTLSATDQQGLLWNGGNVTVTVVPVFFSTGRTAATTSVTFEGKTQLLTNTAGGAVSATFTDGNGANPGGATDIDNITDPNAAASLSIGIIDASGQPFTTNPCGATTVCTTQSVLAGAPAPIFPTNAPFRLDTQKPLAGSLPVVNNALQGTGNSSFVGANFRFAADSAAGFVGPNGGSLTNTGIICPNSSGGVNVITCNSDRNGVDKVTVVFQTAPAGTSKTSSAWTNTTSASTLNETNTPTLAFRMITTDALGNADTSATTTFGVDKTAPTVTQTGGPAQNSLGRDSSKVVGGTGSFNFSVVDNLSGTRPTQLVAQTSLTAGITSNTSLSANEGKSFTNTCSALPAGATCAPENTTGPCVIGRYNASASNAGPNALPVFESDGVQRGFCTPVPYTLSGGNTTIPANFPASVGTGNQQGYFTTEVIAVDQAGNQTSPIVKTVVEDAVAPTVNNIDLPGSITGNSTVSFASTATDNVDIVGSFAKITYNTPSNNSGVAQPAMTLQYATTPGPGVPWDNVLTGAAGAVTLTTTVPNFIKNMQVNTGGGASAPAAGGNASSISVVAVDEVNNQGALPPVNFSPAVSFTAGSTSSFNAGTFIGSFTTSSNTAAVSDCPAAGCAGGATPANPTSATITATATGTSGTFNNPFSTVGIWYQTQASAASNTWFFAGNAGAGTTRDTGNGVTGNRFWDYVFNFTPPKVAPDGTVLTGGATITVRAIGVNSAGDGMASSVTTLTLTNP